MKPTYSHLAACKRLAETECDTAAAALRPYPRNAIGIVPDAIKFNPDYRAKKARYDTAFASLRAINKALAREYPAEFKAASRNHPRFANA